MARASAIARIGSFAPSAMLIDSIVPCHIVCLSILRWRTRVVARLLTRSYWCETGEDARPPSTLPRFVPDNFDAFIERVKGNVSFVFRNHERRREANSARFSAQEQNAAFERQLDDAVALWPGIFFRLLVFDDLHADHQPAAANVTNQAVLLWFFFSSRRRHTRCSRDWSSDVCSSD